MSKTGFVVAAAIAAVTAALAPLSIGTRPAAAANPSFGCTGTLAPAEAVICANDNLSALDRELASSYRAVFDRISAAQRTALENAEKAWIAERNSCGTNVGCITNAYEVRLGQLAAAPMPAPASTANPSFACIGNLLPTDAVICSNVNLAALDRQLAAIYTSLFNSVTTAQRVQLESAEKAWLGERNSCGTNVSCITNAYQVRISLLGGSTSAVTTGTSCLAAVGATQASIYANQCIQVSPATNPPCNAANACSLIISEITRGCALIGARGPSFCAAYR